MNMQMDIETWIELAVAACDDAGIEHGPIEIVMTWDQKFSDSDAYRNSAIFRIGNQRCLKLYGPTSERERQFPVEHSVLRTLADYSSAIPAPRLIAARESSQLPPYLVMTEITGTTQEFLNEPPVLTHSDFSQAHVYIARETDAVKVLGIIDWAEAMLGPPEWDIAFHWFWSFTRDREAMRAGPKAFYPDEQFPERFARRCLRTHPYSFSMGELWPCFAGRVEDSESIVRQMTAFLFPADVFGSPD